MLKRVLPALLVIIIITLPMSLSCQSKRQSGSYRVRVAESIPHDTNIYTQGLFIEDGVLYESSGQYGKSFFRSADIKTGRTQKTFLFPANHFAEGAVSLNGRIYILTWMERVVYVLDKNTFKEIGKLINPREGWGLTTDGTHLVMSDGTEFIYFNDPLNFMTKRVLEVKHNGRPVKQLNELEWIDGEIWANVFMSDTIVIIDPQTGNVRATVNCSGLLPASMRTAKTDVLNGIAYDKSNGDIYLTGKYWPKIFRVTLLKP